MCIGVRVRTSALEPQVGRERWVRRGRNVEPAAGRGDVEGCRERRRRGRGADQDEGREAHDEQAVVVQTANCRGDDGKNTSDGGQDFAKRRRGRSQGNIDCRCFIIEDQTSAVYVFYP